jgi:hypothetical protein
MLWLSLMVRRLSFQVLIAGLVLLLAALAPLVALLASPAAAAPLTAESAAQTKKKPAQKQKQKKKPGKKKQAPVKAAEPKPAKDPWDLPMTVVIVRQSATACEPRCQEWIVAEGEITAVTPALFRKVLKRIGKRKLPVLIQSPGGNVDAALAIGRMLRKAELDVAIASVAFEGCLPSDKSCRLPEADGGMYRGLPSPRPGVCASACPLVVAGGRKRLASPDAWIGLHKIRTTWTREHVRYLETYRTVNGKKKVISRKVVSRKTKSHTTDGLHKTLEKTLRSYLNEMGIAPGMLQDMERAPHESVYWLPRQRAAELSLVTAGLAELAVSETFNACQYSSNPPRNCITRPVKMPPPKPEQAMIVERVRGSGLCEPVCPEWIMADGIITRDTPKRFRAVLEAMGEKKLPVFLNSTHGDFDAAVEIGRMIRAKGLTTAVALTRFIGCNPRGPVCSEKRPANQPFKARLYDFGDCGRECLLVFAGGMRRYAALVRGSHFAPPESLFTRVKGASASDLAEAYLKELSLPPWVLQQARDGSAHDPVLLSKEDLMELRLANEAASPAYLADPDACHGIAPQSNCVERRPSANAKVIESNSGGS